MVKVAALGVVVMLAGVVGELPPPEASYKILMLLPVSTKSHKNIFMALAEALADRGHKLLNPPEVSTAQFGHHHCHQECMSLEQ
ncbi:hypothetical protein Pmani_005089 [Petrolisthes manimaculis]|uniref:Uncharacterized protein n=1 Tax=Petrolisthes manimaculis TaxID=1843537 RepID=A0AAE1QCC7_9EUCA|nr:hypothetical protein Pmani_005089 [Petrolisthes manimaculis]